MNATSSKCTEVHLCLPTEQDPSKLSPDTATLDRIALENSESTAALKIIVSAFVDLGFGVSAAHHALNAANRNHPWQTLADDFLRDAA